jgi:hypothetical protein
MKFKLRNLTIVILVMFVILSIGCDNKNVDKYGLILTEIEAPEIIPKAEPEISENPKIIKKIHTRESIFKEKYFMLKNGEGIINSEFNFKLFNDKLNQNVMFVHFYYTGDDNSKYYGKKYVYSLYFPDLDKELFFSIPGNYNSERFRETVYLNINRSDVIKLNKRNPDGNIPYMASLWIGENSDIGVDLNSLVHNSIETSRILHIKDHTEFNIGVVQVVPKGFDLEKQYICLGEPSYQREGFIGTGVSGNCEEEQSYKLIDVLFSDDPYTTIEDITSRFYRQRTSDVNVYSLNYLGKYWENLLEKQDISETSLNKNSRFKVSFIDPIERENDIVEYNDLGLRNFFEDAVIENNININQYDFMLYILYEPTKIDHGNFHYLGSSSEIDSFVLFPLYEDNIFRNRGFLISAHELGHQIYAANDLYLNDKNGSSYAIKYPEGVPDPLNFPQTKACIMSEFFGLEKISDKVIKKYYSHNDNYFKAPLKDLDLFHTTDPQNFLLCADTIVQIMGGIENPSCSLEEFYAGQCGECTSLDYLNCQRD